MAKKIWLVGIGMGNRDTLTIGAWNILKNCDCLIGAQRMLDAFPELTCRRFAATAPEKIAAFPQEHPEFQTIGVVFSGDVGSPHHPMIRDPQTVDEADFVVIDRDYLACPAEEIKDIQVLQTVVGGETVYQRG